MDGTTRFGVSIPEDLLEKFDERLEEKMYANRSEAIRDMIRDFLVEEEWEKTDEEVYGSMTIVYDHEKRGISDKLTELQHQDHTNIISTMHIHLDRHNCMETMVIKGNSEEIKKIADRLRSTKGVKHGKLMMTSV
ncbi:MAG: nickel-responsive transcriptional regulator NikR [Candidatus Natronoplasma sp.]